MKEGLLEAYIRCLREETGVVDRLYDLALQKRQVIISGDVNRLEEMTRQEGRLAEDLNFLDNRRQELHLNLAREHPEASSPMTGTELALFLVRKGEKQAFELREQVRLLGEKVERLKEENALNLELLEHSLTFVSALQSLIMGERETLYSPKGMAKAGELSFSLVDRKV